MLVPAVYGATLLSAVAVTARLGTGDGFAFRCLGLLAVLAWTLTTFLGTVPINKATLAWRPEAPPKDWRAVVSRWERLDAVRFWAAGLAFAFFLAAVALRPAPNQVPQQTGHAKGGCSSISAIPA